MINMKKVDLNIPNLKWCERTDKSSSYKWKDEGHWANTDKGQLADLKNLSSVSWIL